MAWRDCRKGWRHRSVTAARSRPAGSGSAWAIARVLPRKPRLLLLDEATSQLNAVNEVSRDETVLVVAHHLSTVTMADRIVVLDAGLVRAMGTHAELVAGDPLYAELAATRFLATAPAEAALGLRQRERARKKGG